MFPVFKLAAVRVPDLHRAVSVKSVLLKELTGIWVEDYGMASASGMYNIVEDRWDEEIVTMAGLQIRNLPPVLGKDQIIGNVIPRAQLEYGIPEEAIVVNGSGDGLLANSGSGCDSANRIAATMGTSASARQSLKSAVLDELAGTFCYKADVESYVLGCASSNGGNIFDWARDIFDGLDARLASTEDLPIFIPLLHGERSPDWNSKLTGSWHGLRSSNSIRDLRRSVIEGVVFNLVQYTEIVQHTSGVKPQEIVLSGNGFLNETASSVLASLVPATTLVVPEPGLASLRGAAMCGLRAIREDPVRAMENLVAQAVVVEPTESNAVHARFERYKKLRQGLADGAQ
jgi:gluconokinase